MITCEWNPETNRPYTQEERSHAKATWMIGNGAWFLCDKCAKLNYFDHYKHRKRIDEAPESADDLPEL